MGHIARVAWIGRHFGEEPPLVSGSRGSGAIFLCGCDMRCVFCQNHEISRGGVGRNVSTDALADAMLRLQAEGAANINLVTPNPWWRHLAEAISAARARGLRLPVVWNSNGYEDVALLRRMEGLVDIYLPDFKYSDDALAVALSAAPGYPARAEAAIREMLRQVGHLRVEEDGRAVRGVLVRHLILPGRRMNSVGVLERLAAIDPALHVSLMGQYAPMPGASPPAPGRALSEREFDYVFERMLGLGLSRGWAQGVESRWLHRPSFRREKPFEAFGA